MTHSKGLIIGIILILLGILFVGTNIGLLPSELKSVILSWPMLLIAIGIFQLLNRYHRFTGMVCLLVGGFFIIPRMAVNFPEAFYWVHADFVSNYWPILLIIAGLLAIIRWLTGGGKQRKRHGYGNFYHGGRMATENPTGRHETFSKEAVFGGGEYIVLEPEFKGGQLKASFGGISLDLRKTNLPDGDTYLNVSASFSGITIFVPDSWTVAIEIESFAGGVEDARRVKSYTDNQKRLIITGSLSFSGCKISN